MKALSLPRHLEIKITRAEMAKMLASEFDARKALIEGNVELRGRPNRLLKKSLRLGSRVGRGDFLRLDGARF